MKVREIREAYEELSSTFSKTSRTLALSGIAIAWFFMRYFTEHRYILILIVLSICAFVIMLLADLLQNYILSKRWYSYYITMKETYHKGEDDDIKEDEQKNSFAWFLYDLKFWILLSGYILLAICFVLFFIFI